MKTKIIILSLALLSSMVGFAAYSMEKEGDIDIDQIFDLALELTSASEKYEDIATAVEAGAIAAVKEFLDRGVSPDEDSILVAAVAAEFPEIVELLLEKGADKYIEMEDSNDVMRDAMHWALYHENDKLIDLLIKYGFDINHEGSLGVLLATELTDESIEYLIDKGAHVNKIDSTGKTPLHRFLTNINDELADDIDNREHMSKVKMLCKCGAHIDEKVIVAAIEMQDFPFVKCLYKYGLLADKNFAEKVPLFREAADPLAKKALTKKILDILHDGQNKEITFDRMKQNLEASLSSEEDASEIAISNFFNSENLANLKKRRRMKAFKRFDEFKSIGKQVTDGKNITQQILDRSNIASVIASARAPQLIELYEHISQSEQEKEQTYAKKMKLENK